jgi:glycosyltransferase involved in cell wall biosynthesis
LTVTTRIARVTNFVAPYRLPVYEALRDRVGKMRIFASVPTTASGLWPNEYGTLDVTVQRQWTLKGVQRHPYAFEEPLDVLVPYDTLWLLQRYKPDVVVSSEIGLRTAQALVYRRLRPATRLIVWATVSEHTEYARGAVRMALRRWILPRADAVVVNGESGARYVRRYGLSENNLWRIPQAHGLADVGTLPLRREPSDAHRLLYVGQLVERKGLLPFVSVVARWAAAHPDRRIEFWLVGQGPLRAAIEAFPVPPNLDLRCVGSEQPARLAGIYGQGGIFAFPTLADEWGLVVNEAMAAGLPVLGSLFSQSVEELVRDGIEGWLFRPNQPEEVYQAIDRALTASTEVLDDMRRAARERVQRLTPEFVADRFVHVIKYVRGKSVKSGR